LEKDRGLRLEQTTARRMGFAWICPAKSPNHAAKLDCIVAKTVAKSDFASAEVHFRSSQKF